MILQILKKAFGASSKEHSLLEGVDPYHVNSMSTVVGLEKVGMAQPESLSPHVDAQPVYDHVFYTAECGSVDNWTITQNKTTAIDSGILVDPQTNHTVLAQGLNNCQALELMVQLDHGVRYQYSKVLAPDLSSNAVLIQAARAIAETNAATPAQKRSPIFG